MNDDGSLWQLVDGALRVQSRFCFVSSQKQEENGQVSCIYQVCGRQHLAMVHTVVVIGIDRTTAILPRWIVKDEVVSAWIFFKFPFSATETNQSRVPQQVTGIFYLLIQDSKILQIRD